MEQLLTLQQVADKIQLSVLTLRRAVKSGELEHSRLGKRGQIRVSQDSVRAWISARNVNESTKTSSNGRRRQVAKSRPELEPIIANPRLKTREGNVGAKLHYRIISADVLEGLRSLPPNSVDMWVTSPPYYWQRDYEVDGQIGHEPTIEGYVDALAATFAEAKRTLSDDGLLFLNLGDAYYNAKGKPHGRDKKHSARQLARQKLRAVDGPGLGLPRKSLIGLPWRVALRLQQDGWILRSAVIWRRPNSLGEPTSHDRPWRTTENVFILSKKVKYFFDRSALPSGQEDVWDIAAKPHNPYAHCAPFPVELVQRCIACGCKPGGTVGDMFMGSGTTGVAALQSGRSFIGIELNDTYAGQAERRIISELVTPASRGRRAA